MNLLPSGGWCRYNAASRLLIPDKVSSLFVELMGTVTAMKSSSLQYLSPKSLIEAAKAAHPAFRYAIVVAGLAAIVAVVLQFGASPATLVFGIIILVVF